METHHHHFFKGAPTFHTYLHHPFWGPKTAGCSESPPGFLVPAATTRLDHLVHQTLGRRTALLRGLGAGVHREDEQPLLPASPARARGRGLRASWWVGVWGRGGGFGGTQKGGLERGGSGTRLK